MCIRDRLRAIGFENDKDILEIFNLAEDVKVNKTNLKKMVGRKLAARVLKDVYKRQVLRTRLGAGRYWG